ncbi:uncharacterized protein Z520_06050 [Fonsecaea multimorphosa CBS 102226]|uniref:DNA2/NAM7 helicase-like C-terminal domain-containing protein n=1 Tax=Fonsecaea multimorphosa CBS 102226 TaxID=1442371 RepID=A0A0D2JWP5_9EURO|nr:uncharacterized protein Z520_06050 [Fonsecaea multimorphosa CBS 102226]KIX97972.1 hypothetical protein Z520_06050 [Fonsecaea multimorphosa CBS 102226]
MTFEQWWRFFDRYFDSHRPLTPKDVPETSESSRVSFASWEEYLATLGSGALIESFLEDREKNGAFNTRIKLLGHKQGKETRCFCLFKVPRRCSENFSQGDRASAHLTTKISGLIPLFDALSVRSTDVSSVDGHTSKSSRQRSRGPWDISILPPFPQGPPEVAWALIERRRDERKGEYYDKGNYSVTSFSEFNTTQQNRGIRAAIWSLLDKSSIYAKIIPEDRHGIFVYVFRALLELKRLVQGPQYSEVLKVLLGSRPDDAAQLNIYQSLSDPSLAREQGMNLNESQKEAIRLGHHAPAGFVLCHGGPGTGKTHFIIQAVRPFLLDTAKQHRVLLTAASNTSVDSVAKGLDAELQLMIGKEGGKSNEKYVIRLHSIKTEMSVALREAKVARQANLATKKHNPAASEPGSRPLVSGQAATILAHCQAFAERKYEGVSDERVRVIELSAGERMLEIAGIRVGSPLNAADQFTQFSDLYARFVNGEQFDPADWVTFDTELERLLAFTISEASVICATVGGAADEFCSKNYVGAELIVVDEAARIPEYQMWPLLAFYPNAVGKVLVGDPNQLGPTIKGDDTKDETKRITNPFQRQLELSLQGRLQKAGFQSAFFNVQYRAVEKIAQIYSNVCYGGLLEHGRTSQLEEDQLAKDIIEHNRQTYGIPEPVVFYDIPDATEGRSYQWSRFCKEYAILVLRILHRLFNAGFGTPSKPCSIAILTPYKEQMRLLKVSKASMGKLYPAAKDVVLQTVDSIQGMEYDVVIADPTVVRSPGFLDANRLNVMFSRARYGLYVVGDHTTWTSMRMDDSLPLRKFAGQFKEAYRIKWDGPKPSSPFFDEDMIADYRSDLDSDSD